MVDVIPTILGKGARPQALQRNILFNNLIPLTDGTITQPKPDIYYGARPKELSRPIRDALGHYIMPSTIQGKPLAPNFFIEVKGPNGSAAVATRQVRYDGAIGSRAIHSLQNYEEKLQYDGQGNGPWRMTSIQLPETYTKSMLAASLAPLPHGGLLPISFTLLF